MRDEHNGDVAYRQNFLVSGIDSWIPICGVKNIHLPVSAVVSTDVALDALLVLINGAWQVPEWELLFSSQSHVAVG